MKTQATNLFEQKLICHKADPKTSFEAAEKMIKSGALSRQEQGVWNDICRYIYNGKHKDVTAKELAEWYFMSDKTKIYFTIQRRLSGLYRKGKIERTGQKRNGCCVWRIVGS